MKLCYARTRRQKSLSFTIVYDISQEPLQLQKTNGIFEICMKNYTVEWIFKPLVQIIKKKFRGASLPKRAAILHAEKSKNCAPGRKFGVTERVVRQWQKQRDELFAWDPKRWGFRGPKSGRCPELEAKLAAYVTELHDQSLLATSEMVTEKARLFALEAGIRRSRFEASRS